MKFKDLIDKLLFYVSVPKCVNCGEILDNNGIPLCDKCHTKYEELKEVECSNCFNRIDKCTCANHFLERHFIKKVCKLYRYRRNTNNDIGNKLIYSLKNDHRHDVIDFLATELSNAILQNGIANYAQPDCIITNVPRRKSAIQHSGYDHAELLASAVAKKLNVRYLPLLISKTKKAQKEVTADQRFANVLVDYRKHANFDLKKQRVILVDDIVTSGASMSACATLLRGLGAKGITAACIATAYKDKYSPFNNN